MVDQKLEVELWATNHATGPVKEVTDQLVVFQDAIRSTAKLLESDNIPHALEAWGNVARKSLSGLSSAFKGDELKETVAQFLVQIQALEDRHQKEMAAMRAQHERRDLEVRRQAANQRLAQAREAHRQQEKDELDHLDRLVHAASAASAKRAQVIAEGQKGIAEHGRDPQRLATEQAFINKLREEERLLERNRALVQQHGRDPQRDRDEAERFRAIEQLRSREQAELQRQGTLLRELALKREQDLTRIRLEGAQRREAIAHEESRVQAAAAAGGGGAGGGGLRTVLAGGADWGGRGIGNTLSSLGQMASSGIGNLGSSIAQGFMHAAQGVASFATGAITLIPRAFANITAHARESTMAIVDFIARSVGFTLVFDLVHKVEDAIRHLPQVILGFQDAMVQIQSLTKEGLDPAFQHELAELRQGILEISMETGRSAHEMGQALFFIESHGYKGATALEILTNAAKLAASGLGDTDQVVRVVTGQMIAYGLSNEQAAKQAQHFFDVFAKTEMLSALPIGELAGQMARISPLAGALQIPIEQVGAAIATISQTGLNASRVLTDLIAVFGQLVKSTPQQQEALKQMGTSIGEVREKLGKEGFFAAADFIWEKSGKDIDLIGRVFGDRSRALVGYLALVREGEEGWDKVLAKMMDNAGTVAKVWEINQMRISVQLDRTKAIFEAYGIVLSQALLPDIGQWLRALNDNLQAGNIVGAFDTLTSGFQKATEHILGTIGRLGEQMFGSGFKIVEELARGMWEAANAVLTAVANAIADLIAGFLLGHSWPNRGPLSKGEAGTRAWMQAKADSMDANASIVGGAAERVAGVVNEELAKIGAAGNNADAIRSQIDAIDQQLLPWQLATDAVKEKYEAMLHPLDRQIEQLQHIKDLAYERKQLEFEQQDLVLNTLKLQSEGDPAKRAELAGRMTRQRFIMDQHSIAREQASLDKQLREIGKQRLSPREKALAIQDINDRKVMLGLRKQENALTDVNAKVAYERGKIELQYKKDVAKLDHDAFELAKKNDLQPLIEQRDKIKQQMQTELDYIKSQTDGLEDQKKILQTQLQLIEKRDKAGKAGGAGAWHLPPLDWDKEGGIGQGISKRVEKLVTDLQTRFHDGINTWLASPQFQGLGQSIGGGLIGFVIAGVPGAAIGATLVPRIVQALTERGFKAGDFDAFVTDARTALSTSFENAKIRLKAGDLLGAIDALRPDVRAWIASFDRMLFSEWGVMATKTEKIIGEGPQGYITQQFTEYTRVPVGTEGSTRYTGLGRTIIEAMFGPQDKELNGQRALELIQENIIDPIHNAITIAWNKFTSPSAFTSEGRTEFGPSPLSQLFTAGLKAGDTVLGFVGELATALADGLNNLAKSPELEVAAGAVGKALGSIIMGTAGTEAGSESGVKKFIDGFAALDRSLLNVGVSLGKSIIKGLWQELANIGDPFKDGKFLGMNIVPGGLIDNLMKGQSLPEALWNAMRNAWQGKIEEKPYQATTMAPSVGAAVVGAPGALVTAATTPGPLQGTGIANVGPTYPGAAGRPGDMEGNMLGGGATPEAGYQFGLDIAGGIREGYKDSWNKETDFRDYNKRIWRENVIESAMEQLEINTPSKVFERIADSVLEGFQGPLTSDTTTERIVRMWARSSVIAPLQSILVTGEGGRDQQGGVPGVAVSALTEMEAIFSAAPSTTLLGSLNLLGKSIVNGIMLPIEDGRTGLVKRMQDQIDAAGKLKPPAPAAVAAPAPAAAPNPNRFSPDAPGGDRAATDTAASQWLDIPAGNTSTGGGGGDININAPLIQGVTLEGGDMGDLDNMLDRVREFLVSDIRVARGQGVQRPGGVTPRGSR